MSKISDNAMYAQIKCKLRQEQIEKEKYLKESAYEKEKNSKHRLEYEAFIKKSSEKKKYDIYDFDNNIKKKFFSMFLSTLFKSCISSDAIRKNTEDLQNNLVIGFVESVDIYTLFSSFDNKSYLLSEVRRVIEENTSVIVEDSKKNKEYNIDKYIEKEIEEDIFEELDNDDMEDMINTITSRVAEDIEQFIKTNNEDKNTINNIISDTNNKINDAKTQELEEHYKIEMNRKISSIKNKTSNSLFESIVKSLATSSLINENMNEIYTNNNKLKIDKIMESSEVIYTFLEMMNTSKILDIDKKYIEDMLDNLSK